MSKQSGAEKKSVFKDQRVLLGIVIIAIIAVLISGFSSLM